MSQREYYWRHHEERLAKAKEYRETHSQQIDDANKRYYQNHKEEKKAKQKAYYAQHREQYSLWRQQAKLSKPKPTPKPKPEPSPPSEPPPIPITTPEQVLPHIVIQKGSFHLSFD